MAKSKYGYDIVFRSGRPGTRIWKTKAKAIAHIRRIIKNNSLKQRKMTGLVGMHVRKHKLYSREVQEMKRAKDFIYR